MEAKTVEVLIQLAGLFLFGAMMLAGFWLLDRARHRRDLNAARRLREEERQQDMIDDGDEWTF